MTREQIFYNCFVVCALTKHEDLLKLAEKENKVLKKQSNKRLRDEVLKFWREFWYIPQGDKSPRFLNSVDISFGSSLASLGSS